MSFFAISCSATPAASGSPPPRHGACPRAHAGDPCSARDLGLPSMIGESTPAYVGFDSDVGLDYLEKHFELVREFDLRATSMIVPDWRAIDDGFWAQVFWNGYWPDARLTHFRKAREAWFAELGDPRYIEAGEEELPAAPSPAPGRARHRLGATRRISAGRGSPLIEKAGSAEGGPQAPQVRSKRCRTAKRSPPSAAARRTAAARAGPSRVP